MKFSSEPPTAALFCGEVETSRLKFSSEIKKFDRDWKFSSKIEFFRSLGALGILCQPIPPTAKRMKNHLACPPPVPPKKGFGGRLA